MPALQRKTEVLRRPAQGSGRLSGFRWSRVVWATGGRQLERRAEKGPRAALFGEHWRDWPRKWVQRTCKAAGVPKVTAHSMRGLHSTLAVDSGITSHAVAAALGHESFKTTAESYAQRDAVAGAQQKRVLGVLAGGKIAS